MYYWTPTYTGHPLQLNSPGFRSVEGKSTSDFQANNLRLREPKDVIF